MILRHNREGIENAIAVGCRRPVEITRTINDVIACRIPRGRRCCTTANPERSAAQAAHLKTSHTTVNIRLIAKRGELSKTDLHGCVFSGAGNSTTES